MSINVKKAMLTAAFVTLAPVAPLLLDSASDASAHTYVSGSVTFGSPVAVVGFSYGNPFLYGPVYYTPTYCDAPLYYYPAYGVYAPRYPVYRYYSYSRPRYYDPHRRYWSPGPPHSIRGHGYGGRSRVRGHRWGD